MGLVVPLACSPQPTKSLHQAVHDADIGQVEANLSAGADTTEKDEDGRTCLHVAAQGGDRHIARILIEAGAELEAKDAEGQTPLLLAVTTGRQAVAELLLSAGADSSTRTASGESLLHVAAHLESVVSGKPAATNVVSLATAGEAQ